MSAPNPNNKAFFSKGGKKVMAIVAAKKTNKFNKTGMAKKPNPKKPNAEGGGGGDEITEDFVDDWCTDPPPPSSSTSAGATKIPASFRDMVDVMKKVSKTRHHVPSERDEELLEDCDEVLGKIEAIQELAKEEEDQTFFYAQLTDAMIEAEEEEMARLTTERENRAKTDRLSIEAAKKKQWVPPNWNKLVNEMKRKGTDGASLDKALQEISHTRDEKSGGRKKTGKYLMPEDVAWCRKNSRFPEKDLIKLLKRFRDTCGPKGEMNKSNLSDMFKVSFPLSDNPEELAEAAFEALDREKKEKLDFKDFILVIDAVNCKNTGDKIRWAYGLITGNPKRGIIFGQLEILVRLMDEVEFRGFTHGPTEDERDEMMYDYDNETRAEVSRRADDIWFAVNSEGKEHGVIHLEELEVIPTKMFYAKVGIC